MSRILVVDDEPNILESTRQLLDALGFETVVCDDPSQVVPLMKAERPDLVLHDVRMPGLDIGQQVAAIRADRQLADVPVILFTATLSAKQMAAQVGAQDGLEKPFDPDHLVAVLKQWLAYAVKGTP